MSLWCEEKGGVKAGKSKALSNVAILRRFFSYTAISLHYIGFVVQIKELQ